MNAFHFVYLIFSIVQVVFGFHSFLVAFAVYTPLYGFGILAIFWFLNSLWLLVFGIEGIIYSVCKGGPRFKIFLIMSSAFVGVFFFWSILFMNPCGFYLTGSSEC